MHARLWSLDGDSVEDAAEAWRRRDWKRQRNKRGGKKSVVFEEKEKMGI